MSGGVNIAMLCCSLMQLSLLKLTDLTTSQKVLDHQKHTPVSVCMAPTLTLDSVVKVPFSLNGLL